MDRADTQQSSWTSNDSVVSKEAARVESRLRR